MECVRHCFLVGDSFLLTCFSLINVFEDPHPVLCLNMIGKILLGKYILQISMFLPRSV